MRMVRANLGHLILMFLFLFVGLEFKMKKKLYFSVFKTISEFIKVVHVISKQNQFFRA